MSIAVLRTFVAKRKEEHEALVDKRNTSHGKDKLSEISCQNGEDASTGQQDEMELNKAEVQIDDLSKEATKPPWKVTRELKPPLVLEVRLLIIICKLSLKTDRIRTNIYMDMNADSYMFLSDSDLDTNIIRCVEYKY
jgi:hypothetical protein